MATTVRDVATLAGVSTATVSRALHGHRSISEATRLKVEQAAQQLGYTLAATASDRARVAVVMPYITAGTSRRSSTGWSARSPARGSSS